MAEGRWRRADGGGQMAEGRWRRADGGRDGLPHRRARRLSLESREEKGDVAGAAAAAWLSLPRAGADRTRQRCCKPAPVAGMERERGRGQERKKEKRPSTAYGKERRADLQLCSRGQAGGRRWLLRRCACGCMILRLASLLFSSLLFSLFSTHWAVRLFLLCSALFSSSLLFSPLLS